MNNSVLLSQIMEVHAGYTFSLAVSKSRHVFFFGIMSNSPRGEAAMYPRIQQELYDWSARSVAVGSNTIFVSAADAVIAWGAPVAGKYGVEGGGKNCSIPNFIECVKGLTTINVSCGYGHCTMVVSDSSPESKQRLAQLPQLTEQMVQNMSLQNAQNVDDDKESSKCKGKKRGAPATSTSKAQTKNKKK